MNEIALEHKNVKFTVLGPKNKLVRLPAAKIKIQTYLPFPKLREDDSNDRNRHVRKGSSLEGQGRGKICYCGIF